MMVDAELDMLESRGLIRQIAPRPELEYLFHHWLVQDAAYGSLLKQERRELHRRVGEALEGLYPDRAGELAAVLAIHFVEAGEIDKAIGHLITAGTYGLERNAVSEAFAAFDKATELLPPPTDDEDSGRLRRRVEIAVGRGRAGWSARPIDDLIADFEAILPSAERLADLDLVASIHLGLAMARMQRGEPTTDPVVKLSLDRVTEIGDALQDPTLRALQLAMIGTTQVFTGPVRDGVATLRDAVPLLEQRQDFIGAAFARGALAMGYASLGEFDEAEDAARYATDLAKDGDVIAQLDALIAEAMVRSERGQLDEAVPLAEACVLRSEETGATACAMVSLWVLGDAYQRQGRFADARESLQRGADMSLVVDRMMWRPNLQAWLGTSNTAVGDHAAAAGTWEAALATTRAIGNRLGEAGILWKRAEALAGRDESEAALADFEAAAATFEEFGTRPRLARVLRGWGDALRATGRIADGDALLHRALAAFEELALAREAGEVRGLLAATATGANDR